MCITSTYSLNSMLMCLFFLQIRDSIADGGINIFALSQLIVHGTPCRVTIQLCSRVALMVSVVFFLYLES